MLYNSVYGLYKMNISVVMFLMALDKILYGMADKHLRTLYNISVIFKVRMVKRLKVKYN